MSLIYIGNTEFRELTLFSVLVFYKLLMSFLFHVGYFLCLKTPEVSVAAVQVGGIEALSGSVSLRPHSQSKPDVAERVMWTPFQNTDLLPVLLKSLGCRGCQNGRTLRKQPDSTRENS